MRDDEFPLRTIFVTAKQDAVDFAIFNVVLCWTEAWALGRIAVSLLTPTISIRVALRREHDGLPAVEDVPHVAQVVRAGLEARQQVARPRIVSARPERLAHRSAKLTSNQHSH
jgi:hypothetical protein